MNHTNELIEVFAALKELVELKEMKGDLDDNSLISLWRKDPVKAKEMEEDYLKRKPLAWSTAKRIVAKYRENSKWWGGATFSERDQVQREINRLEQKIEKLKRIYGL